MAPKKSNFYVDPREFFSEVKEFLLKRETEASQIEFHKGLLLKHIVSLKHISKKRLKCLDVLNGNQYNKLMKRIKIKRREIRIKQQYIKSNLLIMTLNDREKREHEIEAIVVFIETLQNMIPEILMATDENLYEKYKKTLDKLQLAIQKQLYLETFKTDLDVPLCIYNKLHLICRRNARMGNWSNYIFTEDMIEVALHQCIIKLDYFDFRKYDNPFFFFTSVVRNEYKRMIKSEKREMVKKEKMMSRFDDVQMHSADPNYKNTAEYHGC